MATLRARRRKKKRSTTLDPTSERFKESARYAISASPSARDSKKKKKTPTTPRMTKSKSPSKSSSNLQQQQFPTDQIKKRKNKKGSRRRATSQADSAGLKYQLTNSSMALSPINMSETDNPTSYRKDKHLSPKKIPKARRNKKVSSQTPARDFPGTQTFNEDDPFGTNGKVRKSSPQLQTSKTMVDYERNVMSSDDELSSPRKGRAQSARFSKKRLKSSKSSFSITYAKPFDIVKLDNSKAMSQAMLYLDSSSTKTRKRINESFKIFHRELNEKQDQLYDDLETAYDDKKEELTRNEKKLFKNTKKKKLNLTFDPNIVLNLDNDKCVHQIKRFGYIQGVDDDDYIDDDFSMNGNRASSAEANFPNGNGKGANGGKHNGKAASTVFLSSYNSQLSALHDGGPGNTKMGEVDGYDDDDEKELSVAQKQKKLLGSLQKKTMGKLETIILMEAEAKRKAKQADELTVEVDESMRYIASRTKEINEKLELAKPELDKARSAVAGIDKRELDEIKALKKPPKVIETVITATAMVLGHKIKEWRDVQRILSNKFKPQLINFDTYTLTKKQRHKVWKKYVDGNEDFNYDRVYLGNKACGNLVLWVLSQIKYSRLLDVIIPLEKEVKKLRKDATKKKKLAKTLKNIVKELEMNITLYQAQCNEMVANIIKSTDQQLQDFGSKLEPLNAKFTSILSNKVLD